MGSTSSAASIWVARGHLTLHNVTYTSTDPLTQQVPQAPAPERGLLIVGSGGTLDIAGATLAGLGAAPPTPPDRSGVRPPSPSAAPSSGSAVAGRHRAGVVFASGSTASIVRSTLDGNGVGLKLAGSHDVQLDTVTLVRSQSAGLVLHGDSGTKMRAVRSTNNAGDGVRVTGRGTYVAVDTNPHKPDTQRYVVVACVAPVDPGYRAVRVRRVPARTNRAKPYGYDLDRHARRADDGRGDRNPKDPSTT